MDVLGSECRISWHQYIYNICVGVNRENHTVHVYTTRFHLARRDGAVKLTPSPGSGSGNDFDGASCSSHKLTFQSSNCQDATIIVSDVVDNIALGIFHPCLVIQVTSTDTKDHRGTPIYLIHLILTEHPSVSGSGFRLKLAGQTQFQPEDTNSLFLQQNTCYLLNASQILYISPEKLLLITFRHPQKPAQQYAASLPAGVASQSASSQSSSRLLAFSPVPTSPPLGETMIFCNVLCLFTVPDVSQDSKSNPTSSDMLDLNKTIAVIATVLHDGSCLTQIVGGTDFLPNVYSNLITCAQITDIHEQVCEENKDLDSKHKKSFQNKILACTRTGQLLSFENGNLVKCVPLEGKFTTESVILMFENSAGCLYYVVQDATIVVIVNAESFEVAHVFRAAGRVFLGDFVGCGGDQLLFVPEEDNKLPPAEWNQFVVTDFHTCDIRMTRCEASRSEGKADESLQAAGQALQGRLQASITYVCGVEREFQSKLQLVEDAFNALQHLSTNTKQVNMSQSGLTPLLDCDTSRSVDAAALSSTPLTALSSTPLTASSMWHRIYSEHWVIGLTISNTLNRTLNSVSVSIIPHDGHLLDSSTFFVTHHQDGPESHTRHNKNGGPKSKVARLAESRHILTLHCSLEASRSTEVLVRTRLPWFGSGSTHHVTIVGSWTDGSGDSQLPRSESRNISDETKGHTSRMPGLRMVVLGSIRLTAADAVNGKLQVQPSLHMAQTDALVLDAVQVAFPLSLRSIHSALCDVGSRLKGALQWQWLEPCECWGSLGDGPLRHARVQLVGQSEATCLNVIVYVRDERQLFLLVHALYGVLPDDVTILPRRDDDVTDLTSRALNAMAAEAEFISEKGRRPGPVSPPERDSEMAGTGEAKDCPLTVIRSDFLQKQRRLVGRLEARGEAGGEVGGWPGFNDCVHMLERESDSAVQSLASRLTSPCPNWGIID